MNLVQSRKRTAASAAQNHFLLVVLLVLFGFFGIFGKNFFTVNCMLTILMQASLYGIMSCGMMYVRVAGKFDLTVGSMLSLAVCLIVKLHNEIGVIGAIGVAMAACLILGALTGFLVGYLNLNALITTLGMQSVISAMAMIYTNSQYYYIDRPQYRWFEMVGRGKLLGIPVQIYIYIVMMLIFQYILSHTLYGHQIKAVGGNPTASRYSGINDRLVIMKSYIISGFCICIAGIVMASRTMAATVTVGTGFEMEVLTACILSGTKPGQGNLIRASVGVVIMGVLKTGYVMMGLPYYLQWMSQCVIMITVAWLDIAGKKKQVAV